MSGHVTLRTVRRVGFTLYVVACEDCDFQQESLTRKAAGEAMVDHALYHNRPRSRSFYPAGQFPRGVL